MVTLGGVLARRRAAPDKPVRLRPPPVPAVFDVPSLRGVVLSGALLVGCGQTSSADAGADAGADARDAASAAHVTDAGVPDVDADSRVPAPACFEQSTGAWIVTRFEFLGENEDGTIEGFDVDGHVSGGNDDEGCDHADGTSPDGVPGIDNQLSLLLPALEATGVDLDALIDARIREGTLLLVAQLEATAEACGAVRFQRGDGEALLDANSAMLPYQTLDLYEGATRSASDTCAWVSPCALEASGELLVLEFLFITQEVRIDFASWQGRFELRDDGSLSGLIGGAVSLESAMGIVTSLGGCGDGPIRDVVEPLLPLFADVFPDESGDCTGLSATVRVEAVPVFLFEGA